MNASRVVATRGTFAETATSSATMSSPTDRPFEPSTGCSDGTARFSNGSERALRGSFLIRTTAFASMRKPWPDEMRKSGPRHKPPSTSNGCNTLSGSVRRRSLSPRETGTMGNGVTATIRIPRSELKAQCLLYRALRRPRCYFRLPNGWAISCRPSFTPIEGHGARGTRAPCPWAEAGPCVAGPSRSVSKGVAHAERGHERPLVHFTRNPSEEDRRPVSFIALLGGAR